MKITLLTNEYPPHIYGGAGVHVEYLTRELSSLNDGINDISVLCFGDQKSDSDNFRVEGINLNFSFPYRNDRHRKLLGTLFRNIMMVGSVKGADIVHCHTWYTHLAGCLVKQMFRVPLVITVHSLEPQRPWKEEQMGSAYRASTWMERTALENADGVIAVSESMRLAIHELYDIPFEKIRMIPNGIDVSRYKKRPNPEIPVSYNISPDNPFILFVGRITRQKGVFHLLNAVRYLAPDIQVVLIAADPDTDEIEREMTERISKARAETSHEIIWINRFIPRGDLISIYSHASIFVCPSIYEPFGLINLEAMACETPVVASAVGGIMEVVVNGETGLTVSFEPKGADNPEPRQPEQFSENLAAAINGLLGSPETMKAMGLKSRERVVIHYSWRTIARQTLNFYRELVRQKT